MKGGSLKVNEIKEFLQSSYDVDAPKNLLGYVLDEIYQIYMVKFM